MNEQEKDSFESENQKYFDEKKFRTIIIGKDGIKNTDDLNTAVEELASGKLTSEERDEVLKKVKASNPQKALLKAISSVKDRAEKARLISVWWEVELDGTDEFLFFVKQACEGDYMIAMESLTVIETIENEVKADDLKIAQELLARTINQNSESAPMLEGILNWVEGRLV